jgi:hypothetical protein
VFDTRKLAQQAQERGQNFDLPYYTDKGERSVNVFMVRHKDPGEPDCFTVHLTATGEWLGYGDTKKDAETCAQIHLHQWADFGIPYGRGTPSVPREG